MEDDLSAGSIHTRDKLQAFTPSSFSSSVTLTGSMAACATARKVSKSYEVSPTPFGRARPNTDSVFHGSAFVGAEKEPPAKLIPVLRNLFLDGSALVPFPLSMCYLVWAGGERCTSAGEVEVWPFVGCSRTFRNFGGMTKVELDTSSLRTFGI